MIPRNAARRSEGARKSTAKTGRVGNHGPVSLFKLGGASAILYSVLLVVIVALFAATDLLEAQDASEVLVAFASCVGSTANVSRPSMRV